MKTYIKYISLLLLSVIISSINGYANDHEFKINVKNKTDADLIVVVNTAYNVAEAKPANYMWEEFNVKAQTENTFTLENGLPDNVGMGLYIGQTSTITGRMPILIAYSRTSFEFKIDDLAKGMDEAHKKYKFYKGVRLSADFKFNELIDTGMNRGGSVDIVLEKEETKGEL